MRYLASIRQINNLRPIPGADRIEVAQVDGWECVVKKNEFSIGEQIVYIEIDSVLPERPEFEFLRDRKFRVRTIKLRGQISQGLVLSLSVLPEGSYSLGDDVTDILGVKKYDPEASAEAQLVEKHKTTDCALVRNVKKFLMRFGWYRRRLLKPSKDRFPDWIAKTDETRIQNLPTLFEVERERGTKFSVTEKVDGQSATYFLRRVSPWRYEFGVCSRNVRLKTPDDSSYWTVAKQYDIKNVLKKIIGKNQSVVLQGEICGRGIQKNKYKIDGYKLFAFNLIFSGERVSTGEMNCILSSYPIPTVPILSSEEALPDTIAELVDKSKGQSRLCPEQKREGVVMRNAEREISFKVINPDYLLEESE